jgi:LacI family transcriptional regulator
MPKMLREATADGLLIKYDQNIPDRMIELINENRIPAIWMNSKQAGDCIYPDEIAAGRIATEKLLELGHTKIGYLCYIGRTHYNITDRFKGYETTMHQAGLPAIWIDQQYGHVPRAERGALMRKWLQSPDCPTAIIAPITSAKILLYTAIGLGINIPNDLSIITFSDALENDTGLPLDTVVTSYYELGLQATEMLLKKITNRTKILSPKILHPKIISGASIANIS